MIKQGGASLLYYVGNGYVVEWRGFAYGCVKTRLKDRGWQYWYKLPFIHYGQASVSIPVDSSDSSARSLSYASGQTMLRGEDVRALQELLNRLGFDCGTADGIFGPKTSAAVKAFQRTKGLEEDGVVGSKTWTALEVAKQDTETESPSDESAEGAEDPDEEDETDGVTEEGSGQPNYGTRLLRYKAGTAMQQGADVLAVQTRLVQLSFDPGNADGIYGPKTAGAVKDFQQSGGITADGIVGPVTREKLVKPR